MFFSRSAIQKDSKQTMKLIYVGKQFYKNQYSQKQWEDLKNE